jgi:hypothetical protein
MTVLSQGWQVQILNALVDGVSIRSTERMTRRIAIPLCGCL